MSDFIWHPCDIVGSKGSGFFSKSIRWFTQGWKEDPTEVSHVAHCVAGGTDETAQLHDALGTHWRGTPLGIYGGNGPIAVYRPLTMTSEQKDIVIEMSRAEQEALIRRRFDYSYGYIGLSAMDMLLTGGNYFFRRLIVTRLPVCSTATSRKWRAAGLTFGADADAVDPDTLFDWMKKHTWAYKLVREFQPIERKKEDGKTDEHEAGGSVS